MNLSRWGTQDSSCSQISTKRIRSISLKIQINIWPLHHGKPRQFQKRIWSDASPYLSLVFWTPSLIIAFLFLMIAHFPCFLASLTFWTSFLSSAWYYGKRSSFIKIIVPFRLGYFLIISNLWSLQLTLTRISLCLWSSIFPTHIAFMRQVVWIWDFVFNCSFTISNMSSLFCSSIPAIIRCKALLWRSWSSSISLLISCFMGLISNLFSVLFRVEYYLFVLLDF